MQGRPKGVTAHIFAVSYLFFGWRKIAPKAFKNPKTGQNWIFAGILKGNAFNYTKKLKVIFGAFRGGYILNYDTLVVYQAQIIQAQLSSQITIYNCTLKRFSWSQKI